MFLSSGLTTALQFTGPEQINADDEIPSKYNNPTLVGPDFQWGSKVFSGEEDVLTYVGQFFCDFTLTFHLWKQI